MANAKVCLSVLIEDTKSFLEAADIIYEKIQVDKEGFFQDDLLAYPYTVLSCYAIESGIKNLLIKNNISFGKKHDLLTLFDLLPNPLKNKIYYLKNVFWNQGIYQETPEEIFRDLLDKNKMNFINARYFFEQKKDDVYICLPFLKATSHAIFDLIVEETKKTTV